MRCIVEVDSEQFELASGSRERCGFRGVHGTKIQGADSRWVAAFGKRTSGEFDSHHPDKIGHFFKVGK
jgi:hypothetical protein